MPTIQSSPQQADTHPQRHARPAPGGPDHARSVAVIGAGPGGLAAAVLLAASGLKVTIFEAQPVIGGRTARIRAGEYAFDRGPTFFMMPYVLEEIFAAAGKRLKDYATLTRLDPMYRLLLGRPGKPPLSLDATQDIAEMARRIGAVNPGDGRNFPRFIEDNRRKLLAMESTLRSPMRSPLDLLSLDAMKFAPMLNPHLSVHGLLSRYFEDPLVRLSVSFQSKYLGMSPFECPSLFTILPFLEYEYGVWHPRGGCNALMEALASLCRDMGVEIRTSCPVERILTDDGRKPSPGVRARGVVADGRELPFAHVVVNADATWAMKRLLHDDARRAAMPSGGYADASLDAKRYSCSTYMLYLGLDRPVDLPHHTIYVSERYEDNLKDICERGSLSHDPSVYVCNPSRTDPTLAPTGHSALYVLMPTPNCKAPIDWQRQAPAVRARVFEQLRDRFGLADLDRHVKAEVQLTPDDWRNGNINFGATFNLAHNLGQMLFLRPQNRLKGFDNVYLVGGGTHPGSGLPTIFLSAQIASRLLCESAGLPFAGAREEPLRIARSREMVTA